jgi:MFS transporter, ACDE family, multidrug resistance protein
VIAAGITSKPTLIVAVITSGLFIGINNTVTTQAVMTVAPVERPVASAAYGFIRVHRRPPRPLAAGRMAASLGVHVPFSAVAVFAAIAILASGHGLLTAAQANAGRGSAVRAPAGSASTGRAAIAAPAAGPEHPAIPAVQRPNA